MWNTEVFIGQQKRWENDISQYYTSSLRDQLHVITEQHYVLWFSNSGNCNIKLPMAKRLVNHVDNCFVERLWLWLIESQAICQPKRKLSSHNLETFSKRQGHFEAYSWKRKSLRCFSKRFHNNGVELDLYDSNTNLRITQTKEA